MTKHNQFDQLPFDSYLNFDELEAVSGEEEFIRYQRPVRRGRPAAMRARSGGQRPQRPRQRAAHSAICSCARCRLPIFTRSPFAFPIETLAWADSDSGQPANGAFSPPAERDPADTPDAAADTANTADIDTADVGQEELFGNLWDTIQRGVSTAAGAIGGALAGAQIIDLTAQADRSNRKGNRAATSVYALVLHQMACCFNRRDPLRSYLATKSHFVILNDGRILQLHPISALLWASNGFNARSVAVEFAGNFPSTRGKWWQGEKYGKNQLTPAQIEGGRTLVRHLIRTMGLTHILAHRQSSATRENDPGPDIWYHVGQWAVDSLGLKDGGPNFKVGDGNPIPSEWRTWGTRGATPELELELETLDPQSPAHTCWLQHSLNQVLDTRLPVNGAMTPAVRSALRSFQRQRGLGEDGELSDEIESALVAEGAAPHHHGGDEEAFIGDLWSSITGTASRLASGFSGFGGSGPSNGPAYIPRPITAPTVAQRPKELSGAPWVARFPTSRSTADLTPAFQTNVNNFISALRNAGATVSIAATYRPGERAALMHYAYRVAREGLDPSAVPAQAGIDISWVHRDAKGNVDLAASRAAAEQMVQGYGIVYRPALQSRHTQRRAIDMTITWSGNLTITDRSGTQVTITSTPRTGAGNAALHRVGASYGVRKLVSDAPHWSDDGH